MHAGKRCDNKIWTFVFFLKPMKETKFCTNTRNAYAVFPRETEKKNSEWKNEKR